MSKLPKIVLLGPAHPYRGGIADTQEALYEALRLLPCSVTLLTFKTLYPKFLFPGKTPLRNTQENHPHFERRLHTYNPLMWWKTARWINQNNFDAVVVRYWTPFVGLTWWGIRFFLSKKIPMLGLVDNWNPHESHLLDRPLRILFEKSCTQFMSLSTHVGNQIEQSTQKTVIKGFHPIPNTLPNPVTPLEARKRLHLPKEKKIIAFVGLIRAYKGLPLLLEAFAAALKKDAELFLTISGEFYSSKKEILTQIKVLGIENHVQVHPHFLEANTLRDYICAADIIAQPYRKATQSGITPLAYYYEKPVLVSAIPGLQDPIVKDFTGKALPREKQLWANEIIALTKKGATAQFKSALQKAKQKYSWSAFAKLLLQQITP